MDNNDSHFEEAGSSPGNGHSRRSFLQHIGLAGAGVVVGPLVGAAKDIPIDAPPATAEAVDISLTINGKKQLLKGLDSRTTLLDLLREKMDLTGTKKGCNHGQCGACTVLVDGQRMNSCLRFAALCDGQEITSIEGLAKGDDLHPVQQAFIKHDAYQCGYCTPGQICSAVGLLKEGHARTDAEIRESMSGNICRCGAYQHILSAIKEVQQA